ncbi:MFS transporter [Micromonospora sp. CPCC 206060]|uniref:MFS transporter n=1 Tax=Micromonospora sp. CPCC 206060 TaxID=3122406 RepID=UPI002FF2EB6F
MHEKRDRWLILGLLTAVEFLVFLDIAIVNIALPSMRSDLGMTEGQLAWVVTAYQLVFGGFLVLGGRASDTRGRRRVYLTGLVLFTVGSLVAALATGPLVLIAARGVQGLGAAALVPTALAMMQTVFGGTPEYNRAFGIWGAMRSAGASSGVALGGILTQLAGWPSVFLINVPLCLLVLVLGWRVLPRDEPGTGRRLDAGGATLITLGMLLVVAAFGEGGGGFTWLHAGALIGGLALLALFPMVESRVADPLVPLRLFRSRAVNGSLLASFLVGISHLALFYFLSLHLQQVAGYNALEAGLAILPIGLMVVTVATVVLPRMLDRFGPRGVLLIGLTSLTLALLYYARVPDDPNFLIDVLPGGILVAFGIPAAFVGVTVPAMRAVQPADSGVTSALVNTVQRLGGGVGVVVLTALGTALAGQSTAPGAPIDHDTFRIGLVGAAVVNLLALVAAALLLPKPAPQPATGPAGGTDGDATTDRDATPPGDTGPDATVTGTGDPADDDHDHAATTVPAAQQTGGRP